MTTARSRKVHNDTAVVEVRVTDIAIAVRVGVTLNARISSGEGIGTIRYEYAIVAAITGTVEITVFLTWVGIVGQLSQTSPTPSVSTSD